jgi:hypothetical protein
MKYELFTRVALKADLPKHSLRSGDIATRAALRRVASMRAWWRKKCALRFYGVATRLGA